MDDDYDFSLMDYENSLECIVSKSLKFKEDIKKYKFNKKVEEYATTNFIRFNIKKKIPQNFNRLYELLSLSLAEKKATLERYE